MKRHLLVSIFRDLIVLLLLHRLGIWVMEHSRLMDQLLSPSPESAVWSIVWSAIFTCIRLFVIIGAPGWVLARVFWVLSRPPDPDPDGKPEGNPDDIRDPKGEKAPASPFPQPAPPPAPN